MEFLRNIENILISASNGVDVPVAPVKFPFVKSKALAMERKGLPTIISLYSATTDVKLKIITNITTLLDVNKM